MLSRPTLMDLKIRFRAIYIPRNSQCGALKLSDTAEVETELDLLDVRRLR